MIEVLLFAHLQEGASKPALHIDYENITVAELKEVLTKKYNIAISNEIMVAINEEYANEDDIIQIGDVVAMIPPVSGG
ncbi:MULTISPECIES: molybdopterin converting factor subunit 1 [Bacillus]|uniref:Molybdopterin synthase sulfur carrier subunit n=2 Tax=Bacillus cereus TaxID=1396 RepID=A0A9X6T6T6_BACCE|nr:MULTISPECIES: molybdopterin converting factor subunit 1 [Bacillus]MBW3216672.1 molybdopterin converting factor subunit 1 [Salmonella enterica subsp. enterica serovar Javiana]MCO4215572.1 molybdopterin converting factor subunit 1 [Bacillus sp. 10017]TKV45996.1 molybdopterin converting factor subunit 1 [Bacillus sp. PIC28]ACK62531.1 molybdopterin converting factor, subunit 1 [Bacillus cereus B4264]ASI72564.1 molybdopterin converting factor subunit 1 [Bacillus cereus]